MGGLENNIYNEFISSQRRKLGKILVANPTSLEEILLIDYDAYTNSKTKNLSEVVSMCPIEKFPDYARSKIISSENISRVIALKHHGLCLICELGSDE